MLSCVLTSRLPPGLQHTQPGLQLTKLFDDPYTPLPQIAWVATGAQLARALVAQAHTRIVLLTNVSVAPGEWDAAALEAGVTLPLRLRSSMVIAGWPSRSTVLDWQRASRVLDVGGHQLELREWMITPHGGRCCRGCSVLLCFALLKWPVRSPRMRF